MSGSMTESGLNYGTNDKDAGLTWIEKKLAAFIDGNNEDKPSWIDKWAQKLDDWMLNDGKAVGKYTPYKVQLDKEAMGHKLNHDLANESPFELFFHKHDAKSFDPEGFKDHTPKHLGGDFYSFETNDGQTIYVKDVRLTSEGGDATFVEVGRDLGIDDGDPGALDELHSLWEDLLYDFDEAYEGLLDYDGEEDDDGEDGGDWALWGRGDDADSGGFADYVGDLELARYGEGGSVSYRSRFGEKGVSFGEFVDGARGVLGYDQGTYQTEDVDAHVDLIIDQAFNGYGGVSERFDRNLADMCRKETGVGSAGGIGAANGYHLACNDALEALRQDVRCDLVAGTSACGDSLQRYQGLVDDPSTASRAARGVVTA